MELGIGESTSRTPTSDQHMKGLCHRPPLGLMTWCSRCIPRQEFVIQQSADLLEGDSILVYVCDVVDEVLQTSRRDAATKEGALKDTCLLVYELTKGATVLCRGLKVELSDTLLGVLCCILQTALGLKYGQRPLLSCCGQRTTQVYLSEYRDALKPSLQYLTSQPQCSHLVEVRLTRQSKLGIPCLLRPVFIPERRTALYLHVVRSSSIQTNRKRECGGMIWRSCHFRILSNHKRGKVRCNLK